MNVSIDLTILRLDRGAHETAEAGVCLLEAVAWFAGEPFSDHPACVCPVIAAFGRAINDLLPDDDRQCLVPVMPRLVGTRSTAAVERRRAYLCADWAVREIAPLALERAGQPQQAERLRSLPPIVDVHTAAEAAWAAGVAGVAWGAGVAWTAEAAWGAATEAWAAAAAAAWVAAAVADWRTVTPLVLELFERLLAIGDVE